MPFRRRGCGCSRAVISISIYAIVSTITEAPAQVSTVYDNRPPMGKFLVDELYLGVDPMAEPASDVMMARTAETSITHVSPRDIDMVLEFAPQPVSLYLELGTYEGGSAILAAQRTDHRAKEKKTDENPTCIVAVDTFLGDMFTMWGRTLEERRSLLRSDGSIKLYERFRANLQRSGQHSRVLPLQGTSVVALKLFSSLAERGKMPRPQVIYLDSAHEEGEVFLEMTFAWKALAPGGIIFGDDWVLGKSTSPGDNQGEGVQRDVLRFAESYQTQLDNDFGPKVQPMRTLGRVRPGLFVSYLSFQWFMKKLPSVPEGGPRVPAKSVASSEPLTDVGVDCWSDGYNGTDCCDTQKYGPEGNSNCWDIVFTYAQCCRVPKG